MAVDRTLLTYFKNVRMFHLTGEKLWLEMLELHAESLGGRGPAKAREFLAKHKQEKGKTLDSG